MLSRRCPWSQRSRSSASWSFQFYFGALHPTVRAITAAGERGATIIVIAHRPSAISALDKVMVLKDGQMAAFGPKDEVLNKVLARPIDGVGRPGGLTVVA